MLSTSGTYDFAMDRLTRPDLSPPGTRTINMNQLGEALAGELPGPPVRALYVYNCNPAAVAPNQEKVLEGLRRDDLFTVVHELFATDTVDYADIVLPATSQLEHVDIHGSYGHHDVMYNPPAIAPRGECRSNNDVFRALAGRLRLRARALPRRRDADPRGPRRRPDARGDHARAASRPRARSGSTSPRDYAPFADGVFPTPSGKCELYSERMKADGLDPLPTYTPPLEDPQTRPELAARYPLQLLSPPRPAVPQLDLRQQPSPPRRGRRADDRARRRGRRGARPERRPVGRGLQRPRPVPGPGRPDGQRPAGRGRRHRHLLEQARPRADRTSTARPPRP